MDWKEQISAQVKRFGWWTSVGRDWKWVEYKSIHLIYWGIPLVQPLAQSHSVLHCYCSGWLNLRLLLLNSSFVPGPHCDPSFALLPTYRQLYTNLHNLGIQRVWFRDRSSSHSHSPTHVIWECFFLGRNVRLIQDRTVWFSIEASQISNRFLLFWP
jgi:hypothetical protein